MKNKLKITEVFTNHFNAVLEVGDKLIFGLDGITREELIASACGKLGINQDSCIIDFDYHLTDKDDLELAIDDAREAVRLATDEESCQEAHTAYLKALAAYNQKKGS